MSLWGGSAKSRTLEHQRIPDPKEYYSSRAHPEVSISTPRLGSTQMPAVSSLLLLFQTTRKTGTQTNPSGDRLPKVILTPQTPQNTPPNVALPSEGKYLAPPTRTQEPVPPTRKATQINGPNTPHGGRKQKQEELQPCSLPKGDLKHSKTDKIRSQRNTLQTKE